MKKQLFTADFETTTNPLDCRVWAWGVCEIGNPDYFVYGNSIESFIDFLKTSNNATFYIHNLKFDIEFILAHIFDLGFKFVSERKEEKTKTFTTLISDMGQFYSSKIIFEKKNKHTNAVTLYDSLKILPFKVEQIAKAFGLPISKLKIDYDEYREPDHILTKTEIDYLRNDCEIVARALAVLFEQGLTKMTQGSNALFDYQRTIGKKNFERWFPTPDYDGDVRQAYKGGFTYLDPRYKEKDIETGLVFDVNSLYPWVLRDKPLPYGEGIYFTGEYEEDKLYNLYVQMMTCQFRLKPGKIPTIQLKKNLSFIPTQYLTSSENKDGVLEEVTMCLSSVDLALFKEHYEILNPVYHSGWKFKSTTGLFKEYIDKWMKVKIDATINKNKGMRTLSKLMLNALYGKFAKRTELGNKIPYMDNGVVKYTKGKTEFVKGLYIPVGIFTTAWARDKTIRSAQKLYDYFVYADTDSLHLNIKLPESILKMSNDELEELHTKDLQEMGVPLPDDFEVDATALGAFKLESKFYRARFIRQKSYIEDWNPPETWNKPAISFKGLETYCEENNLDYEKEKEKYRGYYNHDILNITCAGMPEACYKYVSWDNFQIGTSYKGKLQPMHVKGGQVLKPIEFTIKPS